MDEVQKENRDEVYRSGSFYFRAEDGIRGLVRSRGLGDVYKRRRFGSGGDPPPFATTGHEPAANPAPFAVLYIHLPLPTKRTVWLQVAAGTSRKKPNH